MALTPTTFNRENIRQAVEALIAGANAPQNSNEETLLSQFSDILKEVVKKVNQHRTATEKDIPFSQSDMIQVAQAKPLHSDENKEGSKESEELSNSQTTETEDQDQEVEKPVVVKDAKPVSTKSETKEDKKEVKEDRDEKAEADGAESQDQASDESELEAEVSVDEAPQVNTAVSNESDQAQVTPEEILVPQLLKEAKEIPSEEVKSDVSAGVAVDESLQSQSETPAIIAPEEQIVQEQTAALGQQPAESTDIVDNGKVLLEDGGKLAHEIAEQAKQGKELVEERPQIALDPKEALKQSEAVSATELLLQEAKITVMERANPLAAMKDPGFLTAQLIRQSIQSVQQQIQDAGNVADAGIKVGSAVKAIAAASPTTAAQPNPNLNAASPNKNTNANLENTKNEKIIKDSTLPKKIAFQAVERVENVIKEALKSKEGKTISLRLDPPQLGMVRVDITRTDSGIHVRVAAENPQINNLLREKAHQLQSVLRQAGLEAESVNVSVGGDGTGQSDVSEFEKRGFNKGSGKSRVVRADGREEGGAGAGAQNASVTNRGTQVVDHWVA